MGSPAILFVDASDAPAHFRATRRGLAIGKRDPLGRRFAGARMNDVP